MTLRSYVQDKVCAFVKYQDVCGRDMQGAYVVWSTLPEVIRSDPAFDAFRRFGLRLNQDECRSVESPRKKKRYRNATHLHFYLKFVYCLRVVII